MAALPDRPTGHRRTASVPARTTDLTAPALHELIGIERAGALDACFGSMQPPRNLATDGVKPWERADGTETGRPLMHPARLFVPDAKGSFVLPHDSAPNALDLEALKRGEKTYMWTVSAIGRLIIGEELPAGRDATTGEPRRLGHATLVGGANARISGELRYNASTGNFVVSNRSGRYSRYEDRHLGGLDEVIGMFRQMGLNVEREVVEKYITRKKPEPLVLPSHDPNRTAKAAKRD